MSAYANDGFVTLKVRVFLEAMLILLESEKLATVDPSNERLETGYGLLFASYCFIVNEPFTAHRDLDFFATIKSCEMTRPSLMIICKSASKLRL